MTKQGLEAPTSDAETADEGSDNPETDAAAASDGADKTEAAPDVVGDADPGTATTQDNNAADGAKSQRRQLSISLRSLTMFVVGVVLVGAVATLSWLYIGAQRKLDAQARHAANDAHAEKVALDYAVNAADMNFQDLNTWKTKLVAGTTPELKDKLTSAATSMEQILVPLQWTSSAHPLVAKVRSDANGIYVVDSFVSVQTKTVQSPEPLQSTATYSITLDSTKGWQISDVGGIGAVVEPK